MPVSTSGHISHCMEHILRAAPRSVLDVGCGFGLWGFLCREYLDVMPGRVQPEQWRVRIDGIELFEPYIQAHQQALYDHIEIADIRLAAQSIERYDLIIAGDVIEHLEKADGEEVLRQLYEKADKALLVNIPLGAGWDHPEAHGNPGELHRSQWEPEDFLSFPHQFTEFRIPSGARYGVFLCMKDVAPATRAEWLRRAVQHCDSVGNAKGLLYNLRRLHQFDAASEETAMMLADVLLQYSEAPEAVSVLLRCAEANPGFHYGLLAAGRILVTLKCNADAVVWLRALLKRERVEEDLRCQARDLLARLGRAAQD